MRKIIAILFLTVLISSFVFAQEKPCIYLFYGEGCPHCAQVSTFLTGLNYTYDLNIQEFNIGNNFEFYNDLFEYYEIPLSKRGHVPTVFISDYYCIGDAPCINSIEQQIQECVTKDCSCPDPYKKEQNETKLTIPGITGLALVDAVNPCALAVLALILAAVTLRDPEKKFKSLWTGLFFTFAIFLCYFGMGLLLILGFKAVANIGSFSLASPWFYRSLGILALILAAFNLKDFFKYGAGGFVMEVPKKWRPRT